MNSNSKRVTRTRGGGAMMRRSTKYHGEATKFPLEGI